MRLMCAERDRLWAEYDGILRAYTEAIRRTQRLRDKEAEARAVDAKVRVDEQRLRILQHCLEHGCDPEYDERFV